MKLKYKIIFQQVGYQYLGVAVGEGSEHYNGMLLLNEVGYDIVQLVDGTRTKDDIVRQLLEMYDADASILRTDVDNIISYLQKEGVLE